MTITRRAAFGALAATLTATAALAQGKKGSGPKVGPGQGLIGVDGEYSAKGLNPDGTQYDGTVSIVQQGDAIEMTWLVSGDTIRGQGVIEGRVMTVDWGDDTPVVYVVMPNGELHGTWASGTALERLVRR